MPFVEVKLPRFLSSEDGAVTVDWVVLTAGMIGLCLIAYSILEKESLTLARAAGTAVGERVTELPGGE